MRSKRKLTSLWIENEKVKIIDQTKLPFKLSILNLKNLSDYILAIKEMKVRGAPLIGVTAAFGLAESIKKDPNDKNIEFSYKKLLETRPTAINLKWALDEVRIGVLKHNIKNRAAIALKIAKKIRINDIEFCKKIGEYGYQIIKNLYKKKKKGQ